MKRHMQQTPLDLPTLFRRAERMFGGKSITTAYDDGPRRTSYAEWADRTRRLGGVFDELGVSRDGRVGTFCWNSTQHLELYFAAPCTGRVLHTLNSRTFRVCSTRPVHGAAKYSSRWLVEFHEKVPTRPLGEIPSWSRAPPNFRVRAAQSA